MISVVVEVQEPFSVLNGRPPLLPGVFVRVLIQGNTLRNAVAVPRDAIREGNQMWVVNGNHLAIEPLKIVRVDKNYAYVVSDVPDEVNVVISSLNAVVDGMEVRTEADIATQSEQAKQDSDKPNKPEEN